MSHMKEMQLLIVKHMKDRFNWDMSVEEVRQMNHWEQVWEWWASLAYFKLDNSFTSLEEAPKGISYITVMDGIIFKNYVWKNGEYVYLQEITKDLCREIYGNSI